jgi:hypothetical protein
MCAALPGNEALMAHVIVAGNPNSESSDAFSVKQQ